MRSTALSVHRRRSNLPVDPADRENFVGIPSIRDADLTQAINIDSMLDVFSEVETTRGRVKEVEHLFIVDLQEGALTQELNEVTKLCVCGGGGRREGEREVG